MLKSAFSAMMSLGVVAACSTAQAQVPYTIPPTTGVYHPVHPGGFVTGNPSPVYPSYPTYPTYDPNRPVGGSSSSSGYWDPYRGWVTHTNNTTVLNSALSPGRAPMPGTSIQNYNHWNGSQWVRGQRWLGRDGQWHGVNSDTRFGPNGSTTDNHVYYYNPIQPNGGSTTGTTVYSGRPSR